MSRISRSVTFTGASGATLAARLDLPGAQAPHAFALFAHCFTCSKDTKATNIIGEALADAGIATLRFDFTGLGGSEGEFANTGFSSNIADLVAAARFLANEHTAPSLLIGHSLGGAAVLAAAAQIPSATAIATINAPSDPSHVLAQLGESAREIRERGEADVELAGRTFRVRREFLDDVAGHSLKQAIGALRRALIVFHAPLDDTVPIEHASAIFAAAKHPKSFVSLAGADHLLTKRADARYVGAVLAAWASRYLPSATAAANEEVAPRDVVTVTETRRGKFEQSIAIGPHRLLADEPADVGGADAGPTPYDLLLAALGSCTSMTVRAYADQKKLPLDRVAVTLRHAKIHAVDCAECETREGRIDQIDRAITLDGDLDEATVKRLLEIADKCPVHRTLTSEINIRTRRA
jgi:putative redox protein